MSAFGGKLTTGCSPQGVKIAPHAKLLTDISGQSTHVGPSLTGDIDAQTWRLPLLDVDAMDCNQTRQRSDLDPPTSQRVKLLPSLSNRGIRRWHLLGLADERGQTALDVGQTHSRDFSATRYWRLRIVGYR